MSFQSRKVAIIGAGHVGTHCALSLATMGECDELVLIDRNRPKALAQAADLADAMAFLPRPVKVSAGDYADCRDAAIVLLSAGDPPDHNRPHIVLLEKAAAFVREVLPPVVASGFSGIFLVASGPSEVVARLIQQQSGFPAERVIASSTAPDTARLRRQLAETLGIDQHSIYGYVMGAHGESQTVPWSNVSIGGKPLLRLMSEHPDSFGRIDLTALCARIRRASRVICDGKGSVCFGVGMVLADIIRTILRDEHKILPVGALLTGTYGQRDVYAGVPAVIGRNGIVGVFEVGMTDAERVDFSASCEAIRYYTAQASQF